jgi:phosphoribosylaminoimidazole (AIR) synthetase
VLPISAVTKIGELEESHMFNTFNMGVGMTITLPATKADQALALLHCRRRFRLRYRRGRAGDAGIALC